MLTAWCQQVGGPAVLAYDFGGGPIAQWLEQGTHNPLVPGSSPGGPTKSKLEQELFKQRKRLADAERTLQTKTTKAATESKRIATDEAIGAAMSGKSCALLVLATIAVSSDVVAQIVRSQFN